MIDLVAQNGLGVDSELSKIIGNDPRQISYSYTHSIIELVSNNGIEISSDLLRIICSDEYEESLKLAALYALAFYYKRYNKNEALGQLIEEQNKLLDNHPLACEIKSWFYRKNGQYDIAYQLDKKLIEKIDISTNPVPYISFASSVAYLLEKYIDARDDSYSFWDSIHDTHNDWKNAVSYMESAIQQYAIIRNGKKYGKHFSILGRLYAFSPQIYNEPLDKAIELLDKAVNYFSLAIQYENETSEDYFKRYEEYRQYQSKCALNKLSIISNKHSEELEEKIREISELQSRINDIIEEQRNQSEEAQNELRNAIQNESQKSQVLQNEIRESMEELSTKSIEIVALFTAVIAIVLGGIDIVSNFTIITGSLFMFLFCNLCCMMVCIPAVTLNKSKPKRIVIGLMLLFFVMSIITVAVSIYIHAKGVI